MLKLLMVMKNQPSEMEIRWASTRQILVDLLSDLENAQEKLFTYLINLIVGKISLVFFLIFIFLHDPRMTKII